MTALRVKEQEMKQIDQTKPLLRKGTALGFQIVRPSMDNLNIWWCVGLPACKQGASYKLRGITMGSMTQVECMRMIRRIVSSKDC
jgi:hypothetical protein